MSGGSLIFGQHERAAAAGAHEDGSEAVAF